MIASTSKKRMELPRIVICGSMVHYDVIMDNHHQLSQHKIPTLVPINEDVSVQENSLEIKRDLSRLWLQEIKSPRTYGILVVNKPKRGMDNYIGPNSFAEIVIAFDESAQIFLQYDLCTPYKDELLAWRAVPLLGHLEGLISVYWRANWEREPSANSSFFLYDRT